MAEARLSFEEHKNNLKWYLKFENVVEVQRQWRREYATEPQTRLTVACIRDKFETHMMCTREDPGGLAQQVLQ